MPRWIVVPSGSISVGDVGCTIGTIGGYWAKIAAAMTPSGRFGHGVTFSWRFIRCVASRPPISSVDDPASSA